MAYLCEETEIQFLSFNSCWQIDYYHRKESGIHPQSIARGIEQADRQAARSESGRGRSGCDHAFWPTQRQLAA